MAHGIQGVKRDEPRERKDPAVRLRVPTLIMALFLTFVAIGAAYLAGVMSGRNSASSVSERSEALSAPSAGTELKESAEDKNNQKTNKGEHILSAEELEFARVLRKDENTPLSKLNDSPAKITDSEQKEAAAQKEPSAVQSPPGKSLQKILEAENSDEIADYVFQVGAFKDEKSVDALREKLEGQGLRTLMKREGRLYLVLVRLRGASSRAAELPGLFIELGLGEPILLSRSPIKR